MFTRNLIFKVFFWPVLVIINYDVNPKLSELQQQTSKSQLIDSKMALFFKVGFI